MVGEKLYQKKSQARFFLVTYGLLALAGCALAAYAISRNQSGSNAAGFMIAFGAGMFVLTLVKSRKPQVLVHEDFLEVAQSRKIESVRYRNVTAVSQPDGKRMTVTLREEGAVRNVTIWTRELDPADVGRLHDFLQKVRGRKK